MTDQLLQFGPQAEDEVRRGVLGDDHPDTPRGK